MLRARVVFDCAAAWTRLGVRVTRGRRPRRRRRGWLAWLRGEGETSTNTVCPQDCQEWCASQTFLTGQSLQGQSPPSMLCLLERAASVRMHAYARERVRVCVCVCACVGLHEPHHSVICTRDHHRSSGNLIITCNSDNKLLEMIPNTRNFITLY